MSEAPDPRLSALTRLLLFRLTGIAALVAMCGMFTFAVGGFVKGIPPLPWATAGLGGLMTLAMVSMRIQGMSLEKLASRTVDPSELSARESFNIWALAPTLAAAVYLFAVGLQLTQVFRWPDGMYAGFAMAAVVTGLLFVVRAILLSGRS